jgi:hypothetical protein
MNKREAALLIGALAGVMSCVPVTLGPTWAQTTSSPATSPPPAITAPRKATSATPQMIEEAIQRSQARSAKARDRGVAEQWGSEEPFTYVPGKQ